jgi:hypothetical protein
MCKMSKFTWHALYILMIYLLYVSLIYLYMFVLTHFIYMFL